MSEPTPVGADPDRETESDSPDRDTTQAITTLRAKTWAHTKSGWRAFRTWRKSRPFWGGVITILGALELLALMWGGPIQLTLIQGIAGIGTIAISVTLVAMVLISWAQPHLRTITGILIVIIGLVSMTVSNLGGFVIGMLLTVIGGSLIFSWREPRPVQEDGDTEDDTTEDDAAEDDVTEGSAAEEAETSEPDEEPDPSTEDTRGRSTRSVVSVIAAAALAGALIITPASPAAAEDDGRWWWPFPWPGDEESETEPPEDEDEDDDEDNDDEDNDESDDDDDDSDEEDDDNDAAQCEPDSIPDGDIALGSDEAEEAAEAIVECMDDEDETGPEPMGDADLPPASAGLTLLTADKMTQIGVTYDGIVDVPSEEGPIPALKFSMNSLLLENMDQSAEVPGTDQRLHVLNEGSTAELNGNVELYVVSTEGLLYGLIPITVTPDNPIPIVPPYLVLTEMTSVTAYVKTDEVLLPDLHEPVK